MTTKIILTLALIIFVIGAVLAFSKLEHVMPKHLTRSTTTTVQEAPAVTAARESLLDTVTPNIANAQWSATQATTENTAVGNLSGHQRTTTITSPTASLTSPENVSQLTSLGFSVDNNIAADGPGSSQWGYQRQVNGQTQYLLYSYNTTPSNNAPNQPLSFDCPCQMTVTVFLSDPSASAQASPSPAAGGSGSTTLANPASVNCTQKGGTLSIQSLGNGSQYGLCEFEDNMACEEWAMYRGDCPVGGVKTTGFDNTAQMYCAWLGGQTLAVQNAQCTLPSGKVCPVSSLYQGTCS